MLTAYRPNSLRYADPDIIPFATSHACLVPNTITCCTDCVRLRIRGDEKHGSSSWSPGSRSHNSSIWPVLACPLLAELSRWGGRGARVIRIPDNGTILHSQHNRMQHVRSISRIEHVAYCALSNRLLPRESELLRPLPAMESEAKAGSPG